MVARLYICLVAFFIGTTSLMAQEEQFFDDTTQEVYGPQSTLFITPADLKYNQAGFRPVAMSIAKMHRFTYRQRAGNRLQDLGNDGTAAKPIFYVLPQQIGATTGFYVYDIYFQEPHLFKYYDTKSPYTDGTIVLANYGSYVFDVCHSRSFNQNWHLGAIFQTMLIDKEFIPQEIPGDRQVITYPFALLAHYKTDNARYQVLGSFYRKKHRIRETGGILGDEDTPMANWLKAKAPIKNNLPQSDSVESSELRHQYYLYHQFAFLDQLQAYHEVMLSNRFNHFKADKLSTETKQFLGDTLLLNADSTQDRTVMRTLGNEVGIKGDISRLFYRCYYRHQKINLKRRYLADIKNLLEHYVGLQTRFNLRDSLDLLEAGGEYLWDGFYKFHTAYQGNYLELGYEELKHKPSFLVQHYRGNHRSWKKKHLTPPIAKQIRGGFRLALPSLLLRPHASWSRVKNPIYFRQPQWASDHHAHNTIIKPKQAKEHADILTLSTDVNLTLWSHFHVDNELTLAKVQGPAADVFRMPSFLINTRLYYASTLYEGKLDLETGLAIHWRTPYKPDGYDPATQQFYLQDRYTVGTYPVADLFFSFRIKHFRGFVNVTHLNQGLPLPGYFVTPSYPAQLRSVDVGVSWSFFD